jgi:hypothetical protein
VRLILAFLLSCARPEPAISIPPPGPPPLAVISSAPAPAPAPLFRVSFLEDGQPVAIADHAVTLHKKRLLAVGVDFREPGLVMMNVSFQPKWHDLAKAGAPFEELEPLTPGHGMAEGNRPDMALKAIDNGSHALFVDEKGEGRCHLLHKLEQGGWHCRRSFTMFDAHGLQILFDNVSTVYFVFVMSEGDHELQRDWFKVTLLD